MRELWGEESLDPWRQADDAYPAVIEQQGVSRLVELAEWFGGELPRMIRERNPRRITRDELARATEWKMARGVWRARNLALVRANDPEEVASVSASALASIPDPMRPITILCKLAGVGPATASAIVSAAAPEHYPFFDEVVAAQIPGLGPVAFTTSYYNRYAVAIRRRASQLGEDWTPARVERALWANSGGKAAQKVVAAD